MNTLHSGSHRKGFTLIELLVVIFIIGVLSAIIFPRFAGMREKARDTERMTDVRQIQNALETYFNRYGEYPSSITSSQFESVMPSGVPTDPVTGNNYVYSLDSSSSCVSGDAIYSLRFDAENEETFEGDTTVNVNGSTVCIDLLRSN